MKENYEKKKIKINNLFLYILQGTTLFNDNYHFSIQSNKTKI